MTDTALVTGAARGIGEEVARQLAAAGMRVVVAARRAEEAERVAAEIDGVPLTLDLTDPTAPDAAGELVDDLGGLDVLVNNAAAFADWQETPLTTDFEQLDLVWRTNLLGPWRLVQALAPRLSRSDHPRVVWVTSGSGSHGDEQFGLTSGPTMASYAVTKAAANALVRKLSLALPDARVNAVDPGLTATAPGMAELGARPVAEGAASVVWAATLGPDGPTGGFFRDGNPHPW